MTRAAVYDTRYAKPTHNYRGALGIAGGLLLALQKRTSHSRRICFYLKDIFDSADGQLARAKQLYSRSGRFLDSIGDYIVDLFLFGGIFVLLLRSGMQFQYALLIGIAGFLGVSLRVSYHVFYQTSYLHRKKEYQINRITEELREEDYHEGYSDNSTSKNILFSLRLAGPTYESR